MYYDQNKRKRRIVNFQKDDIIEYGFETLFLVDPKCDGNDFYNTIPISPLHSSAFVDIDADCWSDLAIMSSRKDISYLEIWRGKFENGKLKFCLSMNSVNTIDKSLGHFTIADINRDGLLDVTFPILGTSSVLIALNKLELKFDWASDYCEKFYYNQSDLTIPTIYDEFSLNPAETAVH